MRNKMKKFKLYLEIILCVIGIFFTFKYTYYTLEKNCISLYIYSEKDLSEIYKNKKTENLWFIANKIEIMNECKQKNYDSFLKEVSKNNEIVDFKGYDLISKGSVSLSELATEVLNKKEIK